MMKFAPMGIHSGDAEKVLLEIESLDWPPHQAIFYCGKKAILMAGLIETHIPGVFWSWTIHGKDMTYAHYPAIIREAKHYFKMLDFKEILHIIDKNKPWTKRMALLFGFSYIKDTDEGKELWGISHGN